MPARISIAKLRLLLWRHQVPLSVLYLGALLVVGGGIFSLRMWMPEHLNMGLAVASRSWAYDRTFEEVKTARADFQAGRLEDAQRRLVRFLEQHADVQPGQLYTHAVTDACELLSQVYLVQEKPGKAVAVLRAMTETTPLHYRLWYSQGCILKDVGDLEQAALCLRQAFKLTLNHPQVTEAYLSVLADLNSHEEILWVADHFHRASRNAAPKVEVTAGVARSRLQRTAMNLAKVPIGHGSFLASMVFYGLERGQKRHLALPAAMFDSWPAREGKFTVGLCFKNIYQDLRIDCVRYRLKDGEWTRRVLPESQVVFWHRPHSGSEFHVELRTDLEASRIGEFEIVYSCPQHVLSGDAERMIAKARVNCQATAGI